MLPEDGDLYPASRLSNVVFPHPFMAKKLMRALHIEEKMNAPFSNLSKGERQNVLIARALINDPKILVLDEPGTGLDVYARENMKSIVKNLAEHKIFAFCTSIAVILSSIL